MAEAVAAAVLAGGVVGVGQTGHEDDAGFLTQRLHGHGRARRGTAGDHHRAVLLDHRAGGGAGGVRLGLRVAGDELDLLAEDAVTLQRLRREGAHHAAVALAIEVLDSQTQGPQLIGALVGVDAGLGHVEAQGHAVALRLVGEAGPGFAGKDGRRRQADACNGRALQQSATADMELAHEVSPIERFRSLSRNLPLQMPRPFRLGATSSPDLKNA